MPNTLGVYNPIFYAQEALIWLQKALGLANRVHMGFDAERRAFGKGDTINIRRPSIFTAAAAPASASDLATETVAITLGQWFEVKFALTDKELAYTQDRIISDHIMPASYALADKIDQDLASLVITVPHAYVEASAATAATVKGLAETRQRLFDLKCPLKDSENMFFMVGGQEESDLLQLAAFSQWQGAGAAGVDTQATGALGRKYGFEFFANQNRTTAVYDNISDFAGAINNAAGYAKGATSIAVDGLGAAEVYKKGTIITMSSGADSGSEYALTADATMVAGGATVTINPGLRNAVADNDTFRIGDPTGAGSANAQDNVTDNLNVGFHRGWAALAFARLPDFDEFTNRLGAEIASVQDPVTGLAVRSRIYYVGASSKIEVALDVLYGFKELDADLACRYEVKKE